MVSTLASQLQQLREGGAGSKQKAVSFLYDEREAARVDDETVYNVAWNGLLELQQLDARLDALVTGDEQVARLFSRQRIHFHRAQIAKLEDAELDAALAKVLDALSGFFLLGATHKVLEFLVRRYEIHRYNVDAVMAVIISYHESKWFGRMVRLLHIHDTRWEFLLKAKQTGEPLLRAALVQRAHDENSVLTFIFDAAKRIGAANPKLISLYTMVTLELLERETPLREQTLRWLIPQLLTALKATKVPELQSSAYMIVTKLASKSSLTEQVVSTIVKSLLKHAQPGGAQMNALLCVMFVIQSQTSFAFSKSTVKYLTQIDNVADLITEATASYDSARFLQLLTAFLAQEMEASDDDHCRFLVTLVESVPIAQESIEDLVASLIAIAQNEHFDGESNRVVAISTVLAALGKQHMTAVDSTVNSILQNQRSESTDKKAKKALSEFLTATFSSVANSAHFVPSNTNAATSLALALDHPTEHIRYQALVSLEKKYQAQSESPAPILESGDVLLRRLQDDSERIVKFISTSSLGELLVSLTPRKKAFSSIVQTVHKWAAKGAGSVTVLEAVVGFALENFRAKIASTDFDDRFITLFIASVSRGVSSVTWARVAPWIAALKTHPFSASSGRVVKLLDGKNDESMEVVVAGEFGKTLAENVQALLPFCLRWSKVSEVNTSALTPFLIQVLRSARSHATPNDVVVLDQALRAVAKKELRDLYESADRSATNAYAVKTAQALCEACDYSLYTSSRSEFDACVATLLQSPAHLFILLQAELIGLFHDDLETELLPTLARLATASSNDVYEVLSKTRALDIICAALEDAGYSTDKEIKQVAHIVPVVLVSLGDLEQPVRQSAVACLERWLASSSSIVSGKKNASLKSLQVLHSAVVFLLKAKQDIVMDCNAVNVRCAMYGSEFKSGSAAFYQLLMDFVSGASADELVIAVKLLGLLSSVKEGSFWKQSLDFFEQTLAGYTGDNSASTSLLSSLIAHYLDVDVAVLPTKAKNATPKVSKEFFDALMGVLNVDGSRLSSLQTLQIFALSHLSRGYFEELDNVAQYALVGRLLRLLMIAEEAVATKLIASLNSLPIDSAIFVSLIAEAINGTADLARLSCILEVLSIKVDSEGPHAIVYENDELSKRALLNALGSVLSLFCASEQEKTVTQYMLQILFQCLRRVCDNGNAVVETNEVVVTVSKRGKQAPSTADPEALVKNTLACLSRESTSPATRNEALLFVSALVNLYPANVLRSLDGVLSFVGAGSIRQEDEYTFHVLETIIKSVVPHILQSSNGEVKFSTQQFLSIFVSAFEQIPVTKRLALFQALVTTLGPEQHLAYCVALLLQRASTSTENDESHEQFAHSLCLSFGCIVQISSTVKILRLARDLVPFVVDESDTDTDDMDDDEDESELPSDPTYEPLAVAAEVSQNKAAARKLNSLLVSFVASHLQSRELHRMILTFQSAMKVNNEEEEEDDENDGDAVLQQNYLMLAQVVLLYFRRVAHEQSAHDTDGFWSKLAASSMEILASLQQLLSTPGFVAVISELLHHDNSLVRKKAMQLFNERLQNDRASLSSGEELLFIDMLDELNTILQNADGNENSMNIQTALLSVDILARNFAAQHTKRFQAVLPTLVKYVNVDVARASTTVLHIMGCAFVALSSVCRAVGPIVFPLLPTFFPKLLAGIDYCSTTNAQAGSEDAVASISGVKTVLQCLLTALEVFTEKIPQFLAPYLSKVIQTLLAPALVSTSVTNTSISMSVDCCLLNLTNHLELRQLLPSLFGAYDHALTLGDSSVEKLFSVVATVVGSLDSSSLRQYLPNFARFFVTALDIRRVHASKLEDLEQVEDEILECFVQFVLKLSEKQLKPLFLKVSEWAQQPASSRRGRSANLDRRIAFSKLMVKLSERLRGIFVPYYAHVMDFLISGLVDSREVLTRKPSRRSAEEDAASSSEDDDDDFFTRDESEQPPAKKSKLTSGESDVDAEKKEREALTLLLHTTVRALDGCFVHDTDGFMEKERFDAVMTPLVNLFDVLKVDRSDATRTFVFESVATTLANLAWAAKNDLLWKPMHYAVLMKSRGDVPAIRLAALKTVEKCYQVIGDEFLAMLPESIPFLAELMEDTDAEVERTCHEVIKQIEDISGESLDQYLTS